MPFGNLNKIHRLGIGKHYLPNAYRWAREIMRLPSDSFNRTLPIHQHPLVRSRVIGPADGTSPAAAEQATTYNGNVLLADDDVYASNVLRGVSLHDSDGDHSQRNVVFHGSQNQAYTLQTYANAMYSVNQIFQLTNEPDAWGRTDSIVPGAGANDVDNYFNFLPNDYTTFKFNFWNFLTINNPDGTVTYLRRIKAAMLALVFLKLRLDFGAPGNARGHVVLPSSPSGPIYGPQGLAPFWEAFYDSIHYPSYSPSLAQQSATQLSPTVSISGQSATKITPAALTALNWHNYSAPRGKPNWGSNLPLETAAEGMYYLRKSMDWYRTRYMPANQNLPLDVFLSEFGFQWNIPFIWRWAGGFDNFRDGLAWWNSWLCWVMRYAPSQLKLAGSPNGDRTDAHAVYGCILEAQSEPYTTFATEGANPSGGYFWQTGIGSIRNQLFFNCDTGSYGVAVSPEFIVVNNMVQSGRFSPVFSNFPITSWNDEYGQPQSILNFRLGPFGACYKVWAEVGADTITGNISTGWMDTTLDNQGGTITLNLEAGYNTVFIPVIKPQTGGYPAGTKLEVKWGSPETVFGYCDMADAEFPDSKVVTTIYDTATNPPPPQIRQLIPRDISANPQTVISAMVFPVVCKTTSQRTITIKVVRKVSGPTLRIGRPIVIPRACSWLTNQ